MTVDQADYFLIPLLDGRHGLGQVLEASESVVLAGLTGRTAAPGTTVPPFRTDDILAFVRLDPALIVAGTWPLAGFDQIPRFDAVFDLAGHRATGFADLPVHDPAVIEAFLNACHGLYPWDSFGDLFDRIHRPDLARPGAPGP